MAHRHTGRPGSSARKDRMTPDRLWAVPKETFAGWWNDNVPRMGAALAYYTLFALAPILVVVIAVGGMAFGPEHAPVAALGVSCPR